MIEKSISTIFPDFRKRFRRSNRPRLSEKQFKKRLKILKRLFAVE